MPLSLLPANNDGAAHGLCLLFSEGDATVPCNVAPGVIEDLVSYHRLTFSKEEIVRIVLPVLDRLATTKYRAGRLEEDGAIIIRAADLLRYGFGAD